MNRPNFFLVGAPKCGTTALCVYLNTHPNVFLSKPKEPHFFAEEFRFPDMTTWDEYLALFADARSHHKVIGEASVHYLCSALAMDKIHEYDPKAKIIAMVRNPVDVVYSYHSQLLYNVGDENEEDFEKAWHLQNSRLEGKNLPPLSKNPATLQYKNIGSMGTQIEKLFSIFPQEQIKVIIFDDFKADTQGIYEEVLRFLDIPSNNKTDFSQVNKNKTHRLQLLSKITQKPPKLLVETSDKVKDVLGVQSFGVIRTLRNINKKEFKRPPLDPKFRALLVQEFADEVTKLSRLLNRDLSHWKN